MKSSFCSPLNGSFATPSDSLDAFFSLNAISEVHLLRREVAMLQRGEEAHAHSFLAIFLRGIRKFHWK